MSLSQNFLTRQLELNHIDFWLRFSEKTIWVEPFCLLVEIFLKDSMAGTILPFSQNFRKRQYGLNLIVLWSKLPIKTIWIKLFCFLIKIFQKDYMD